MITAHNMTWYKRAVYGTAETYVRTPIEQVHWEAAKAANVIKSGLLDADMATVFIPVMIDDKSTRDFDFRVGDILVKGIVSDEISSDFTPTKLFAKYPEAIRVTSVDYKDYGSLHMRHWQLGGK